MSMKTRYLGLIPALALAGCVTVPSGPTVMVLPGTSKSAQAFQADNAACQQFAHSTLGINAPPGQQVADPAGSNAAVGAAVIGAIAGAAFGAITGQAGQGAAIGAGTGLLYGSAAGANMSSWNNVTIQRQYDNAFLQCMYAKGNQIPVRTAGFRNG